MMKIFGIGRNKTGTTSLKHALGTLGFRVGSQPRAELLIQHWSRRNWGPIIKYCRSADAFQDIPFSLDFTYQAMDQAFPRSKFILTVRKNAEEWWGSTVRWMSKARGRLPTEQELAEITYRRRGWILETTKLVWDYPAVPLWDKTSYMQRYVECNQRAMRYFKYRSGDLLVLNVANKNAYKQLSRFLGVRCPSEPFPWKNRTQ